MADLVQREDRNGVATLTLNRPAKLNALNGDVFGALDAQIKAVAKQKKEIGVVVLRGASGNFSAGYDLAEVALMLRAHAKPHYQHEVIERLAELPQPVIAAVQGECSTGALELALACDLIVTEETARFSDAHARWGLTPLWGMSLRLPLRVGTAKAREMMFTGRRYSGRDAVHCHLANFCFPNAEFEAGVAALAKDILENSWYANRVIKRALLDTEGLTLREARGLEIFKNEGVAPDALTRVGGFVHRENGSDSQ